MKEKLKTMDFFFFERYLMQTTKRENEAKSVMQRGNKC